MLRPVFRFPNFRFHKETVAIRSQIRLLATESSPQEAEIPNDEEGFRVLDVTKKNLYRRGFNRKQGPKMTTKQPIQPPRAEKMPIDQDWGSVWPAARSFHPASVPLPLRMGYVEKGVAPGKFANAELMKIPNFLHLTPPVVARQCEALKKFCTPWPEALQNEEEIEKHFPLEFASCDYLHSGSSIRDPNSRIVTLKFKLSTLRLNKRSKDKFLRLVGEKYNQKTDTVTIVVDRCPVRRQNLDFARYVFTVLYHESQNVEDWEAEKTRGDLEEFIWSGSGSEDRVLSIVRGLKASKTQPEIFADLPEEFGPEVLSEKEVVRDYSARVKNILEGGETDESWDAYAASVKKLLDLPKV